jgi:hypothetical protein
MPWLSPPELEGTLNDAYLPVVRRWIIAALKDEGPFPEDFGVRVEWGRDGEDVLPPAAVSHALYGLERDWPASDGARNS